MNRVITYFKIKIRELIRYQRAKAAMDQWNKGTYPLPNFGDLSVIEPFSTSVLKMWEDTKCKSVVFWGWHPTEFNTMTFEYQSLKRLFNAMGIKTFWFEAWRNPNDVLAKVEKPILYFTGDTVSSALYSYVSDNDYLFTHYDSDIARWKCTAVDFGQLFLDPSKHIAATTLSIGYPSDLLPQEISNLFFEEKDNKLAFFVGSQYSSSFLEQHRQIQETLLSYGINYKFLETWDQKLIHSSYLKASWAPIPQLNNPAVLDFLPSRFVKALSRGTIPLSINPRIKPLLGEAGNSVVFGKDWNEVATKVNQLINEPKKLLEMRQKGLQWAKENTAVHYFENLLIEASRRQKL